MTPGRIKPGTRCLVAYNSTRDECRAHCVGRHVVTVHTLVLVQLNQKFTDAWTYAEPLKRCPKYGWVCNSMAVFPDADLEPLPPDSEVVKAREPERMPTVDYL